MSTYHLSIDTESGRLVLYTENSCGTRPITGWENLESMRAFADMLLDFYWRRKLDELYIEDVSYDLIQDALGKDGRI